MAISVSRSSVDACKRVLGSLSAIIDKAEAYAVLRKIEPTVLLNARLFPDMFSFTRQVQATTDNARNVARLAGVEPLKLENTESSFAELKLRIDKSIAFLDTLDRNAIDASGEQVLAIPMGSQTMQLSGADYLHGSLLPNFYFHAVTAYDVLRHNGVDVGKRDFLGMR